MNFDVLRTINLLYDPVTGFDRYLRREPEGAVEYTNNAAYAFHTYVSATLVNADRERSQAVLAAAHQRSAAALQMWRTRPEFVPKSTMTQAARGARLHGAKAIETLLLRQWLLSEPLDEKLTLEYGRLTTERIVFGPELTDSLGIALAVLPLASFGCWDAIRDVVEAHPKFGTDKCKPQRPTQVAYLLATEPEQRYDLKSPALKKAAAHLRANIHSLATAHVSDLLHWLRIVEWRDGTSGLAPRQVVLRAYAYMPGVEPPETIADEVADLRGRKS